VAGVAAFDALPDATMLEPGATATVIDGQQPDLIRNLFTLSGKDGDVM
jgi:hypothetical protein